SLIIDLAIEVRRSGLFVAELTSPPMSAGQEVFQEITKIASSFYNDLARRFKKINQLNGCSEAELFRKIVLLQHIMDRVINSHLKFPLFGDDKELTEYLLRLVEVTFEICAPS
ncbi:MAG: hypothetical protein ACW98Y_21685, partial [Candidatus Thorarchaeota archaeon]